MSIINDSHAIGVDTRNLVLKTRGTLHVKVGNRFYEIDFRNLAGSKEDEEKAKEEYIITIDSETDINNLEYPGDNKLIIGLSDGSLFITKDGEVKKITPKNSNTPSISPASISKAEVSEIKSAFVSNMLYGNGGSFDFINGNVSVKSLSVENSIDMPHDTVKNRCCRTYIEVLDDDSTRVARKYSEYDFVEIVEIPDFMILKSGAIVKSSVDATIPIRVSNIRNSGFTFESGGLYIVYTQKEKVIITKLN